jgi:glycerol-3-phosphate dehydrogenase (NAD(P)+)
MNITVLGAGAWGTTLGLILDQNAHCLTLWGHDPARVRHMALTRRNEAFLPGIDLPERWRFETDIEKSLADAELVLIVVPSIAFRDTAAHLRQLRVPVVTATKGIEYSTGLTMGSVLKELLNDAPVAALSGPSLAPEVARGTPTAVVAASDDPQTAELVQNAFHRPAFRVYRSIDRIGVELGGALKNVFAIAAGVCDGLGFGDNSKAALITRGQAEMRRLGVACGARPETFTGLSGLGDLTVTCFSRLSRNRTLGERLGRGQSLDQAIAATSSVAEGVPTTRAALRLAKGMGVEVPIISQVHAMLFEGKDVQQGVRDLLGRELKEED